MKNYMKSLVYTGEEAGGQGMSEYVILLGAVVAVAAAGLIFFRDALSQGLTDAGKKITDAFTTATTGAPNTPTA